MIHHLQRKEKEHLSFIIIDRCVYVCTKARVSLFLDGDLELGVDQRVLELVLVHVHHEARRAPHRDDQQNRHPNKRLHRHQLRILLRRHHVPRRAHVVRGDVPCHSYTATLRLCVGLPWSRMQARASITSVLVFSIKFLIITQT